MRTDAILVHIPRTAGYSITTAFDLAESHEPAVKRRQKDPETWGRAFTFSLIRNPWDHAVALWLHTGAWKDIGLARWVRAGCPTHPLRGMHPIDQWAYLVGEDGEPIVDALYNFGSLPAVFDILRDHLDNRDAQLPHTHLAEYEGLGERKSYQGYYNGDHAAIDRIAQRCSKIIDLFGFTYDGDRIAESVHVAPMNAQPGGRE